MDDLSFADYIKFRIPVAVMDDVVVWGDVALHKGRIPELLNYLQHNEHGTVQMVEAPYRLPGHDDVDGWLFKHLRNEATYRAGEAGESIVSMSPLRRRPLGYGYGTAYVEYRTVPLTPWKD